MTQKRTLLVGGQQTEITIENYSLHDIVKEIQDMGILVEVTDLTHPNCTRITHLCECILYLFLPWLSEDIEKERQDMNRISQHYNTETGVFNDLLIIFQYFQALLQDLQYTDFDIEDMIRPTEQRLVRMLNVIVNYGKFTDICWSVYEPFATHSRNLDQNYEQLHDIVSELESAIKEIEIQNNHDEPQVRRLQDMISDVEHEIREFRLKNEELIAEHEQLKKTRQELKDSLESSQFCILEEMEISNHYKRLKDFQVDYVKDAVRKAEEDLLLVKKSLVEQEKSYHNWTLKCALEKNIIQSLARVLDLFKSIHNTKSNFNRSKKTNDTITKEFNALELELKKLDLEVAYTEREVQQCIINKQRLDAQQKKKQESMDLFRENAKKSDKEFEEQSRQIVEETKQLVKQCQEIDRQIENIRKSYSITDRTFMEHISRLRLQINKILPAEMQHKLY